MDRKSLWCIGLLMILLLSACGQAQQRDSKSNQQTAPQLLMSDSVREALHPTTVSQVVTPRQVATPTPTPKPTVPATANATKPSTSSVPPTATPSTSNVPSAPTNIPGTGTGAAPYGPPPPLTAEEIQLAQQLFALINSDRAARGLYPFIWNDTLAGGARLHAWNMVHCGFSHTCPDGLTQCQRIYNEGFTNYTDCGENIAYAGPYPTAWAGVYSVQEGMINEPPTGWHRIHLTSTTLHRIGVGVYVDQSGYIWFVEDMVS